MKRIFRFYLCLVDHPGETVAGQLRQPGEEEHIPGVEKLHHQVLRHVTVVGVDKVHNTAKDCKNNQKF